MNPEEYNKVKEFNYLEFCDYLQKKYGIGTAPYFSKSWSKNPKCARTKEGLIAHHKHEDHAILLGEVNHAMKNPYEWQLPDNIVYCDYLEHLFLHILICENPSENQNLSEAVGIGGVINFIVPELNDLYCGWVTGQTWRAKCHSLVINDKEVYLTLLKRFKMNCKNYPLYTETCLLTCFNEQFGLWSKKKNESLFKEINNL